MKKPRPNDPEMLDEYDFSGGVRGKHYRQFVEGTNVVVLDPDVAEMFPDAGSVNETLRALGHVIEKRSEDLSKLKRRPAPKT